MNSISAQGGLFDNYPLMNHPDKVPNEVNSMGVFNPHTTTTGVITTTGNGTGQGVVGLGGSGINVNGGQLTYPYTPSTVTTPWTVTTPDMYGGLYGQPGIPYTQPRTLKDVLGEDAAKFIFLPSLFQVGSGKERFSLTQLLLMLNNVPFIELNNEVAVAPEVYHAIIAYAKMGEGFAGLGLIEYLN